ncbi:cell division inhibition protein DicB, partial [Escherichia coli]
GAPLTLTQERELLNKICIVSMLARLRLMPKGCAQ